MVKRMPASQYVQFFKAAKMLFAEKRLTDVETASFTSYKSDDQDKVIRNIQKAAKQFLFEPLTDFKDFAASVAKRLTNG